MYIYTYIFGGMRIIIIIIRPTCVAPPWEPLPMSVGVLTLNPRRSHMTAPLTFTRYSFVNSGVIH